MIPQLSDGVEVLNGIDVPAESVALMVLIPNSKGLDNALQVRDRFHEAAIFVSASQTHNSRNVNRTVEETMADITVWRSGSAEGLTCAAVVATSFGCPYEGKVPMDRVLDLAEQFAESGATEIGFGDTTGMANPGYVGEFFRAAIERLPGVEVTAHFHNTRGQGLANALRRAGGRMHELRVQLRRTGRMPGAGRAPPATSPPRTSSACSTRWACTPASRSRRVIDAARKAQRVLGRKLTSHCIVAGAGGMGRRPVP